MLYKKRLAYKSVLLGACIQTDRTICSVFGNESVLADVGERDNWYMGLVNELRQAKPVWV